jgi:fumarate hydratase class II
MLTKIDANQAKTDVNDAKTDADLREMRKEMTARLEAMIQTNQEKTDAKLKKIRAGQEHLKEEMMAKLDAHHERIRARMDSQLEKVEACLGRMKPMDLGANPRGKESEAEHEEIHKDEVAMKTFGALKKRHGDRHLAVGRHGKPKERTQGDSGSMKKFATACRGMICHAGVAQHKGHGRQGQGKDSVAQGTHKGRTFGKTSPAQPECNNGI